MLVTFFALVGNRGNAQPSAAGERPQQRRPPVPLLGSRCPHLASGRFVTVRAAGPMSGEVLVAPAALPAGGAVRSETGQVGKDPAGGRIPVVACPGAYHEVGRFRSHHAPADGCVVPGGQVLAHICVLSLRPAD